jgi:hypothetical protein
VTKEKERLVAIIKGMAEQHEKRKFYISMCTLDVLACIWSKKDKPLLDSDKINIITTCTHSDALSYIGQQDVQEPRCFSFQKEFHRTSWKFNFQYS